MCFCPFAKPVADIFLAVIAVYDVGFSASFDDRVEGAGNVHDRQSNLHLNTKPFAVKLMQNIKSAEGLAIA